MDTLESWQFYYVSIGASPSALPLLWLRMTLAFHSDLCFDICSHSSTGTVLLQIYRECCPKYFLHSRLEFAVMESMRFT